MDTAFRDAMARLAAGLPTMPNMPPALSGMGAFRSIADSGEAGGGFSGARQTGTVRVFRGCGLRAREKVGSAVGKTKRGKGAKFMAAAGRAGVPVATRAAPANQHEIPLVEPTVEEHFVATCPARLTEDRACDKDPMNRQLATRGIELIAPHRGNRINPSSQDGRALLCHSRRDGFSYGLSPAPLQ